MTEIVEVKDFIPAYTDAVQKLLEQLTNRPVKLTGTTLREIISQENTDLYFLLADLEIAGMCFKQIDGQKFKTARIHFLHELHIL